METRAEKYALGCALIGGGVLSNGGVLSCVLYDSTNANVPLVPGSGKRATDTRRGGVVTGSRCWDTN